MQSFEVEVKSLLGGAERAQALRERMKETDPASKLISKNKQLNHYFVDGDFSKLAGIIAPHLSAEAQKTLADLVSRAKSFSLRTRDKDGMVLLVAKVSVGDDTSDNGVSRIEFEEEVDMTLDQLDALVLSAGFVYQAKWSREREEYAYRGLTVCLDKNAGYGWLAEFEKVIGEEAQVAEAQQEIHAAMGECGIKELSQERLERMFGFYNAHWSEYYGTDKIFTI